MSLPDLGTPALIVDATTSVHDVAAMAVAPTGAAVHDDAVAADRCPIEGRDRRTAGEVEALERS